MDKTTIAPCVGNKVRISSDDTFNKAEGIIMDLQSDINVQEGPIAVFFGLGNDSSIFPYFMDGKWKGEYPTPENYKECTRVYTFTEAELRIVEDFSLGYKAKLLWSTSYQHSLRSPKLPKGQPETYLCTLAYCQSGFGKSFATHKAIMNCWGHIIEMYTCESCHTSHHGMCCDSFPALKDPLWVRPSR